jgi:hypothetical protein
VAEETITLIRLPESLSRVDSQEIDDLNILSNNYYGLMGLGFSYADAYKCHVGICLFPLWLLAAGTPKSDTGA